VSYKHAILGCGRVAGGHANAYSGRDNVHTVAGAEVDPGRRDEFADAHDIPKMYSDYGALLAEARPDIVSVCTWPGLHAEMTATAAEAGVKAVHCEKPMAVSLRECREMVAACDANGAKLVIGHQHRWDGNANVATALVAEGAIGELQWIYGYCGSRDLLANGTHVVDLVRFLVDDSPARTVMGQIDRPEPKVDFGHEVEHSAIAHIYFENGVRAFIEQGDVAPPPYAFQLIGTAGSISLNAPDGHAMRVITVDGERDVDVPAVNAKRAEVDALLTWLDGGQPHPCRGENGVKTHEILMAVYESSRRHGAVSLPLDTDEFPLLRMIQDGDVP
jgi:UDP-N-acetylglucosamine 3-dehydrogenase